MIRPSVIRCHGCDSDKCQGTCDTAREDAGHGGFCLIPAVPRLGPWRTFDRTNARAQIARNLVAWACIQRDAARRSDTITASRFHRAKMRRNALLWRSVREVAA